MPTTRQLDHGVTHEFFGMHAVLGDAECAQAVVATALDQAFATASNAASGQ